MAVLAVITPYSARAAAVVLRAAAAPPPATLLQSLSTSGTMQQSLLGSHLPACGEAQVQRRRKWETIVCFTLAICYSLTVTTSRNSLFTAKSSIAEAFGPAAYGNINALGYATYGAGKLIYGVVVDLPCVGGRVAFFWCMIGTGLFTSAMSLAQTELQFSIAWALARAMQASGWIGMVKIVSAWTPHSRLGRTMAFMNLASYLGDFATRLLIGAILAAGIQWRSIFWMSGATIAVLVLVTLVLLKPSPESMGLPPIELNPHRVVQEVEASTSQILRTLFSSAEFIVVLLLSVCLQTAREAFNTNSQDLLVSQGAPDAAAAALSSAFPLMGVPACLFFGWLIDKYQRRRNGEILMVATAVLLLSLGGLVWWLFTPGWGIPGFEVRSYIMVTILLMAAGFAVIGPYSLLAGVFASDLGGETAAATACSLIDFAGYCGSIVLMLVSDKGIFALENDEGKQETNYKVLFLVFGVGGAAVSVVLSIALACVKRQAS